MAQSQSEAAKPTCRDEALKDGEAPAAWSGMTTSMPPTILTCIARQPEGRNKRLRTGNHPSPFARPG